MLACCQVTSYKLESNYCPFFGRVQVHGVTQIVNSVPLMTQLRPTAGEARIARFVLYKSRSL